MGLFSGGFGSGLVEGLAEGVDQSLKNAMEKRDKELSSAKEFWMTRQAQKMDLADDHDARAEKALDQFISEFDGDVAKGLAAYKHFGTVEKAEAGLAEIEATRAALPGPYNLQDHFTFKGIDLPEISLEQARGSIGMEIKPVSVPQMEGSGLLSKIGFGKDLSGEVEAAVNARIPERTRTAIDGLAAAAYDRSGTITSITQRNAMEKDILRGEDRLFQINGIVSAGMYRGEQLDEHDRLQYQKEAAGIIETMGQISEAKAKGDAVDSGPTASQISSALTKELAELETTLQFSKTGNVVSIMKRGEDKLTTDGANEYWNQESTRMLVDFIKVNVLDEAGEFVSSGAQQVTNLRMLSDEVDMAQQEIAEAKAAEEAAEGVPGEGEGSLDAATGQAGDAPAAASAAEFPPTVVGTGDFTVTSEAQLNSYIKNQPIDYIQGAIIANTKEDGTINLNKEALRTKLTELGADPAKIEEALALIPTDVSNLEPAPTPRPEFEMSRSGTIINAQQTQQEMDAWDAQYGQTHNRDGSVKG